MFLYYIRLSILSYRRNPVLSSLMVLAVAVGVGAFMVMFTLNYVMGGDPIPQKSDQLFHIQLDYGDPADPASEPPPQLTYRDSIALLNAPFPYPRVATSKFQGVVEPENTELNPFYIDGRGSTADFFKMFDVPFAFGTGWDSVADESQQQVLVLSEALNLKLFGGENSVGRVVNLASKSFRVIGVLENWQPAPKFYDVNNGGFSRTEEAYIPWSLIAGQRLQRAGNTSCWAPRTDNSYEAFLDSECAWVQFWVELSTREDKQVYTDYLAQYVAQERGYGRMQIPQDKRLYNVREWLVKQEVQPDETRILTALAAMLLAVCLLNTVGLLLAKFLGKASEIGVRQALGAHKGSLLAQHIVEAGFLGLMGGVLGLGVSTLGLKGAKLLMGGQMNIEWMQLDPAMIVVTVALAILSSIAAGIYPTWRACSISPATHLKIQ